MAVRGPNRAFRRRDFHRRMLTLHIVVMLAVVLGALALNRFATPERFWAHWVAVAWLPALIVHAGVFARSTLATMGGHRRR